MHDPLMANLMMSRKRKKIPTLLLCAHYPCEMAKESNIDLPNIIQHTLHLVRLLVQKGWDKKRIVALLHIDYDGRKKRTYYLEGTKENILFT